MVVLLLLLVLQVLVLVLLPLLPLLLLLLLLLRLLASESSSAPLAAREQSYGATTLAAALPDDAKKQTAEADADEGAGHEVEPLPRSTRQRVALRCVFRRFMILGKP